MEFRKSSYSATESHCVEVADTDTGSAVRDTQHRELGKLFFSADEWQAFIGSIQQ